MMLSLPHYLYKIVSFIDWQESQHQKEIKLSSMDQTFIHLAEKSQVTRICEKFFSHQEVVILQLELNKLQGRLVKEKNPGGSTEYYHLYDGRIPMDAIVRIHMLKTFSTK